MFPRKNTQHKMGNNHTPMIRATMRNERHQRNKQINPHPNKDPELFESVAKLVSSPNVTLISYDGLVTGSSELREDNKNSYYRLFQKYIQDDRLNDTFAHGYKMNKGGAAQEETNEHLTLLGQYSVEYDKPDHPISKTAEPHYDGFLVGIALLNDATFNQKFQYMETKFSDTYLPDDIEFQPSHLVTDIILNGKEPITIDRQELNYQAAIHIFVLGPLTRSCLRDIVNQIQNASGKQVIIHVQGEANGSTPDTKTTVFTAPMMTPKPGMFPTAFNLYTGEREMHALRTMVGRSYTVAVKPSLDEARHAEGKIRYPVAGFLNPPENNHIPAIYDDILGFIEKNILTTSPGRFFTEDKLFSDLKKINIALICQDFFDKDNGPAAAFLLMFSKNTPRINLINRRVYDLNYPKCTPKWAALKDNHPYLNDVARLISELPSLEGRITPPIGFAVSKNRQEWHSPVYVKDSSPVEGANPYNQVVQNGPFQKEITVRVREAMQVRFPVLINDVLKLHNIIIVPIYANSTEESTTDGEDEISWTRRAPFSEPLYVPRSHFWSLYYPEGLPNGKKYDDPVDLKLNENRQAIAKAFLSTITKRGGRYSRRKMPKNKLTQRRKNKNIKTTNKKLKRKTNRN